jgi:hypothetical protein
MCPTSLYAEAGTVIDGDTGKPLSGVYVVTTWSAYVFKGIESSHSCFQVDTALTDTRGSFNIPSFSGNVNPMLFNRERAPLWLYKKGYAYVEKEDRGTNEPYVMVQDNSRGVERLKYISRTLAKTSCGSGDEKEERKQLLPVYKLLCEEAQEIAKTTEERRILNGILLHTELLEFGDRGALKAYENYDRRSREWGGK